ncbi:7tm Odorant receptor [Popillia japonica]|uniref:7tm Odorant receptor n=1 Tax=Popillia japonica TaxID=7064 RepID=A0AAW1KM64_POPJA
MWFLVNGKHKILSAIEAMDNDLFKPRSEEQKVELKNHLQNMINFCYTFVLMGAFTCTLFGVFPFTDSGELKLPLAGWYPFQSQLFVVLYAYQLTQETSLAICNISIDCITVCFLDHMCNHIKILNNQLKHMKEICHDTLEKKKLSLGERIDNKRELQKLMDDLLVKCFDHYTYVLRMKRDVEEIFGMGIFVMFMFDCIALCMTMFQLLIISFKSIQFISIIIYMICITTELMAYCWFGNELLVVSSQVAVAAYESDWTDTPVYFQKNLLMFITITMKPMKVKVVHLNLSVDTFTAIMRTAWSYFAVLRQKYNENT